MITKINQLKSQINIPEVKELCESTIAIISSAIYKGVTAEAQLEIERVALTNLFEGLKKYSNNKIIKEWVTNQQRLFAIKHIGVRKAINSLLESDGKDHPTLKAVLENFKEKLDENIPEVLLYEEFISALNSYNYIPKVNSELDAIKEKVKNYKNDIDITKIIETMKETRSNYLIPLIEDVVEGYLNNKTEQTKNTLKQTLMKFSYDPFIRDIISVLTLDSTQLQLEYANAECAIEDKIYSPILYLGKNEALFNVKGTYYVKRGNFINKLKKNEVENIDPNFKLLCESLNLPNVEISSNEIKVYLDKDIATIKENKILINDKVYNSKQLNEAKEIAKLAGKGHMFDLIYLLKENFNEIGEIDFVKRVYLKENENYAADIFKLRNNIFITTFDPINNKVTFYRNINPIQAEKIMMEHMRFDVSKTFADILPNKEKILSEIEETKKEYVSYITSIEEKINEISQQTGKIAEEILVVLKEELENVKNEYKNYLNEVQM